MYIREYELWLFLSVWLTMSAWKHQFTFIFALIQPKPRTRCSVDQEVRPELRFVLPGAVKLSRPRPAVRQSVRRVCTDCNPVAIYEKVLLFTSRTIFEPFQKRLSQKPLVMENILTLPLGVGGIARSFTGGNATIVFLDKSLPLVR